MTFCTAHRPHRVPLETPKPDPAPQQERRLNRPETPRIAPDQIFSDWASI
ncbi:hypothetical protein [Pseudoruegeria sp. HB172150]|nr:hypothetical protein [Pseudoruegeria sp. HB172150]